MNDAPMSIGTNLTVGSEQDTYRANPTWQMSLIPCALHANLAKRISDRINAIPVILDTIIQLQEMVLAQMGWKQLPQGGL
jgi:hypothetical protein